MTNELSNPYEPLPVEDAATRPTEVSFLARIAVICVCVMLGVSVFVAVGTVTALFANLSGNNFIWFVGLPAAIPAALVAAEWVNRSIMSWLARRSTGKLSTRSELEGASFPAFDSGKS